MNERRNKGEKDRMKYNERTNKQMNQSLLNNQTQFNTKI